MSKLSQLWVTQAVIRSPKRGKLCLPSSAEPISAGLGLWRSLGSLSAAADWPPLQPHWPKPAPAVTHHNREQRNHSRIWVSDSSAISYVTLWAIFNSCLTDWSWFRYSDTFKRAADSFSWCDFIGGVSCFFCKRVRQFRLNQSQMC